MRQRIQISVWTIFKKLRMNSKVEVPTLMKTESSLLGEALVRICVMFASYLKQVCALTMLTRHIADNLDSEKS